MNQSKYIVIAAPVIAIPTAGGGKRGAWIVGREYLRTEHHGGERWDRHLTHFDHPQVKGTVVVVVDKWKGLCDSHTTNYSVAPELMMQGYAVAGMNLDVRHTRLRRRDGALMRLAEKHEYNSKDYEITSGKHYFDRLEREMKKMQCQTTLSGCPTGLTVDEAFTGLDEVRAELGAVPKRVNVGTIGHVSHGKTALATAILGALKK